MKTAIKFCGICRREDVLLASDLGAAYVGAIFAPSPRRITPEAAADIFAASSGPKKVGVFGGASAGEILEAAGVAALDVIQLHSEPAGGMIAELRTGFRGEIWAVVRIADDGLPSSLAESSEADAILVDSYSRSQLGGTGRPFDWARSADEIRRLAAGKRLIVAGGLDPQSVGVAIHALDPDVVDVSSGVESAPGVKDDALMRAFASAVAAADAN